MNKKQFKNDSQNKIEIGARRTPKKKIAQQNPFARINLHPLEELELESHERSDLTVESLEPQTQPRISNASSTSSTSSTLENEQSHSGANQNNTDRTTKTSETNTNKLKYNKINERAKLEHLDALVQPPSPMRDFQKVPNSVTRDALPAGLFRGKSKQVWDYLWSVSRGSFNPTRIVRKSRKEIMKGSGIGSMVTVDAALLHLELTGLLGKVSAIGSSIGNEYEIFTPDEITQMAQNYPILDGASSTSSTSSLIQKVVQLDVPLSGTSSSTQVIDNKDIYSVPKTSLKTKEKIDDDEGFTPFNGLREILEKEFRALNGKGITANDAEALKELAELLVNELREARSKTKSISKPSAFLVQHLKTRLTHYSASKLKPNKIKPDMVGKNSDRQDISIDLSAYTPEEIEDFQDKFCLSCGINLEECRCEKRILQQT